MKISPARTAAFDILKRIQRDGAFSSALLAEYESTLSRADRALCHELTLGTLRRQIYLDRLLAVLTKNRKLDVEVLVALRLGLYQLIYLDRIPAHSAVNESVNLVLRARKASAKAFVNGVLRTATRSMPQVIFADELERISIESSHPRWLVEKWAGQWGVERSESIARANNDRAVPAFRVVRSGEQVDALLSRSQRSEVVDGCFRPTGPAEEAIELASEGLIYFQDEASQMAARSVLVPERGTFIDLCAAPGGKTTLISLNQGTRASLLIAGDMHESRTGLLQATCERQTPGAVKIVRYDATAELPFPDRTFDSILLDAPCSGTGTIRHNPELRYRVAPGDLERLPVEQLKMLKNASKLLKPGGTLHYSTCSLEPEENEGVCGSFLERGNGVKKIVPNVPGRFITADGYARTAPDRDAMDGFFMAAFAKV